MVVTTRRERQIPAVRVPDVQDESYGATQIGPFDYVPKVGFREYWYPCVWTKEVGRKPKNIKMLGDELVLFRGKNGKIVALNEWCPHRGARLSRGFCEFEGTVTCPYHGYTFDETGNCVAGLIESTESPLVNKMRTRVYPTAEWNGIVLVWMGETDPVPFEEDLPYEFSDSTLTGRKYTRVKTWETNWTEPMNQGIDYHEFYLHRGLNFWRFVDYRLPFWRPKSVSTGGTEIVSEGEDNIWVKTAEGQVRPRRIPRPWQMAPKDLVAQALRTQDPQRWHDRHRHGRKGLGHLQPQPPTPNQDQGLHRQPGAPEMGRPRRRAEHPGLDFHRLQDSQDLPRKVLDGCLVLPLEQARPSRRHQRKRRPGSLQERAHQPGAPPEARPPRQGSYPLPPKPGQALPRLPAPRRCPRLPQTGTRPRNGP